MSFLETKIRIFWTYPVLCSLFVPMSSYFQNASNPRGSVRYAEQVVRGYLDGKEKSYMVTDAIAEMRICVRDHPAIGVMEHALTVDDEPFRLNLMARALKLLQAK